MRFFKIKSLLFTILFGSIFTGVISESNASSFLFQGKCGFLISSSYQDQCSALFSKNILTLIPKRSKQIRIWPQQISSIALASEESLVPDENLEKWRNVLPQYRESFFFIFRSKKKDAIPQWVLDSTSKKVEQHKFTVRYIDKYRRPQALLFVLDDKSKASGMLNMLESYSGLPIGGSRTSNDTLSYEISRNLSKEAMRKARRLAGLCDQYMFEDADPIAYELDSFVQNTIQEISLFQGTSELSKKLTNTLNEAMAYCENEEDNSLFEEQQAREEERRLIEVEQQEAIKLEKEQARAAFDMLAEF